MGKNVRRAATLLCAVAGTYTGPVQAGAAQEITPKPSPTPPMCARPNIAPATLLPATAVTPTMAEQQGIVGSVQVIVSLDFDSNVVGTRIASSPSVILNRAALAAARATLFQTEIRDCRPLAGDYLYAVDFTDKVTFFSTKAGEKLVEVIGEGFARRRADVAFVLTSANDAAFNALKAKLAPLGIGEADFLVQSYVQPRSSPAPGATSTHAIEITVRNVTSVKNVVSAAASLPAVEVGGIRFALREYSAAYNDAIAAALKDAEQIASDAVTRQHSHLGQLKHTEASPNPSRAPIALVPLRRTSVAGDVKVPDDLIPDLEVRATVTLRYAVTP